MDLAGQSMLAIAIVMALVAGAILGHILMPVYVYVTITVTKEVTVTKTITVTRAQEYPKTNVTAPTMPTFTLQDYRVVVYANRISLLILFRVNNNANITLVGPNNATLSSTTVKPTDSMAYLAMAPPGVSPKPGRYKLIVTSLDGLKIYEKILEFQGPKLRILNVSLKVGWDNVVKGVIRGMSMSIVNEGDMPAIIKEIVVQVDSRNYTVPMEIAVPVGEARIDLVHATIAGLDKGSHKVDVILLGSDKLALATYTMLVNIP